MLIFTLSDLHLSKGKGTTQIFSELDWLCAKIRSEIQPGSMLLFIILGDIIESGETDGYTVSQECLDHIKLELREFDVRFEIVPGNHDLDKKDSSLTSFDAFASQYCNAAFCNQSVYAREYDGVNFIFADSNLNRKYNLPGRLDLDAIQAHIRSDMQNVLFCHHGFTQSNGSLHDTVGDGGRVLRKLEEMGIAFAIHGHTHKADITYAKDHIAEVGCGALSKDVSDMNGIPNQFCLGGIRDGKIIFIERWANYKDGGGGFDNRMIYPIPQKFTDPETISKKKYNRQENYSIPRKVLPHSAAIGDIFYFTASKARPLVEILRKHINVQLLSDAGQGKSVALEQLAYELNSTSLFPILVSLRNYQGEHILDLLPKEYQDLSPSRWALLFDGYDELSSNNRTVFERQLQAFTQDNPSSLVLVAARSNFCRTEADDCSATFPGFRVFDLCTLSRNDIVTYLNSISLDAEKFLCTTRVADVEDLLTTPFYLVRIAAIFLEEGQLPARAHLMDRLIEYSFQNDCSKAFLRLEDQYQKLFSILERLALSMQLLQNYCLDNRKEYQELFTEEERHLAKNCGLLQQEGAGWRFTHNNFREYLAARCLSRQDKVTALDILSDGEKIKPSWVNTLGYLTALDCKWNLQSWLAEHDPVTLVKFERDRVGTEVRNELFQQIFLRYEERLQYFQDELCTVEQLTRFAVSDATLTFLLNRIRQPVNDISQQNALRFLRFFPTHLFDRKQEVLDCLVSCCQSYPSLRDDTCRLAIACVSLLGLNTPMITEKLMKQFGRCRKSYIRLGMYEYLLKTGEYNNYVSYFLRGIPYITPRLSGRSDRLGNEQFLLNDALAKMSTPQSVCSVLSWFAKSGHTAFYDSGKIFHAQCRQAARLYSNRKDKKLYNAIFSCFQWAVDTGSHQVMEDIIFFFRETCTLQAASIQAAEAYSEQIWRFGMLFQKAPEALGYVKEAYLEKHLSSSTVFHNLVKGCASAAQYEEFSELIWEREQVQLPKLAPPKDYEAERKKTVADCFALLFDRPGAEKLFGLPLPRNGQAVPTIEEIMDRAIREDPLLLKFCHLILPYVNTTWTADRLFSEVNWDHFVLAAAKRLVVEDKVVPTQAQIASITRLLEKAIKDGAFENAVAYHENGVSISSLAETAVYWTLYLDFPLEDIDLHRLIAIPSFVFGQNTSAAKYEYLERHIPCDRLRACVVKNIREKQVQSFVLEDHIEFCLSRGYDDILKEAGELCADSHAGSGIRSIALKYVLTLADQDYVRDVILPCADEDILLEIDREYTELPSNILCAAMEREFAKNHSMTLMAHLITMGSRLAIEYYAAQVKKLNCPPGHDNILAPTDAIGTIRDPQFLPQLGEMLETVLGTHFIDNKLISLHHKLSQSLVNCGATAPQEVSELIKLQCKKSKGNQKNIQFCNAMLDEIEHRRHKNADRPKPLQEVKSLLLHLN